MRFRGGYVRLFSCGLAAAGILAITSPALAVVKREGTWPAADPKVSLDVAHVSREEAIRKLAEAAGWSVVVHAPSADPVDVHVKDQPAGKVLDLLLLDADYVATRDGTLVSIRRAPQGSAATPPATKPSDDVAPTVPQITVPQITVPQAIPVPPIPGVPAVPAVPAVPGIPGVPALPALPDVPSPPAAPAPPEPPAAVASAALKDKGRDLDIAGDDVRIRKNEVVHNVTVMGGKLEVQGTVTGNVKVMGGAVRVRPGAHVMGDISAFGGDIRIDDDGRVDGSIQVAGGGVRRGEKAIIGGSVKGDVHTQANGKGHGDDDSDDDNNNNDDDSDNNGNGAKSDHPDVPEEAGAVGAAFARAALLFVFGTVLLALQPERMDALKAELVARPMRTFAMGVLGAIGYALTLLLLCVTVIGVPFALIAAIGGAFALFASMCAVLETIGRAISRHRTTNPYVHLGLGCGLFLVATAIPVVGGIVGAVIGLLATGMLVTTRVAGLLVKPQKGGPYRASPAI